MDCLFCKISAGEIESNFVYEDEKIVAFKDIAPQAPQHILIIPREHIATLNDLNQSHAQIINHMVLTATSIAKELNLADDGYRLVWNCNEHGGQAVYHIHLHLLGGRAMSWPPG